jgi:hypothetical protein
MLRNGPFVEQRGIVMSSMLLRLALALSFAMVVAPANAQDLESLLQKTTEQVAGQDFAKRAEAKTALRLLATHARLIQVPVRFDAVLSVPPKVSAPNFVLPETLKGPLTYPQVQERLRAAQAQLKDARNQDLIATFEAYVRRWEAISAAVHEDLTRRVKARGKEESFALERIDSFAALDQFVNENKRLKQMGEGKSQFANAAAKLPDVGEVLDPETLKRVKGAGLSMEKAKRLAALDGPCKVEARFALGEGKLTINGLSLDADAKHIDARINVMLNADRTTGSGTWSGTADGKNYSGEVTALVFPEEGSVTFHLYLGPKVEGKTTWSIWTFRRLKNK